MLIGDLTHVNRVQNDEFKADKALKVAPFFLFYNFILSKKKNDLTNERFVNKREFC